MKAITQDGKRVEIELTQEASIQGGSFPVGGRGGYVAYNGRWYEAAAEDKKGREYIVRWIDVDWNEEDESRRCNWKKPDYVDEQ